MSGRSIICPNCERVIDEESNYCKNCGKDLQELNFESFITKKSKIITIIGVFGALSLYLANLGRQTTNNFLNLASAMSLFAVIIIWISLLSGFYIYITKFFFEIKKERSFINNFRAGINLIQLILLEIIISIIILSIVGILLSSQYSETIINFALFAFLILIMYSTIYLPSIQIILEKKSIPRLIFSIIISIF